MNNQFPTKLILLRKHFNYSQQDLAMKMNVSLQEYMGWENGSSLCSMAQLQRLSRIFKVSLDVLFDNTIEVEFPEEVINHSVEIPFQNMINENKEPFNNTENLNFTQNVAGYETSSLDKTIITRIINDNQMEEVSIEETVVLKKPPVTEKVNIVKDVPVKKINKLIPYTIIGIAGFLIVVFVVVFLGNLNKSIEVLNTLGETNRLVASQRFSAYLTSKGTIVKTGGSIDTKDFKDVVQISSRQNIILGLNSDGTVVCGGTNCDVKEFKDVVSISAGNSHALALTKENKVLCSGSSEACKVENWSDVSYIYAGNNESYAISNGSILYSGLSNYKSQIESISGVKAVDTSSKFLVALTNGNQVKAISLDGSPLLNTSNFNNITQVAAGDDFIAGLNSNGTVSIVGDEKIVSEVVKWTNIKYLASYDNYIIGINNNNIIYGAGDNSFNQYEKIEVTPTPSAQSKTKLDKVTSVSISENGKNLLLTWDAIKNADYYQVSINVSGGYTVKTSTNSLTIDAAKLTANTEYMISVVSHSNKTEQFEASDIAVVNYRYIGKELNKQYKVIFYDYDGKTVLSEQLVDEGGNAVAPSDPVRSGYVFSGWNGNYFNITKETKIYAQYTKITYTINFYDIGGTQLLATLQVDANMNVTPPGTPSKTNAKFKEWTPAFEAVATKNVTYTATYECTIEGGEQKPDGSCDCPVGTTLVDNKCVVQGETNPTTNSGN